MDPYPDIIGGPMRISMAAYDDNYTESDTSFPGSVSDETSIVDGEEEARTPPNGPVEMCCEVKEYEARYDSKGGRKVVAIDATVEADIKDEGRYALRLYKYYDRHNEIQKVRLDVPSPHIRTALCEVVKQYPRQNLNALTMALVGSASHDALACVFHYRDELRRYRETLLNPVAQSHVSLLLSLMGKEFRRELQRYESGVEMAAGRPSVEFRDAWMLFKPGDYVFSGHEHKRCVRQIIDVRFQRGCMGNPDWWAIAGKMFVHDGTSFGYKSRRISVEEFEGSMPVDQLSVFPLKYLEDREHVVETLKARGRRYCALSGIQHQDYDGIAVAVDRETASDIHGLVRYSYPEREVQVRSRVMLDIKNFREERTGVDMENPRGIMDKHRPGQTISDDEYLLSDFDLGGFALEDKTWCWFHVDFVKDIEFDTEAFAALKLPAKQKRLVRALTTRHTAPKEKDGFDDLIQGKGKGCIFLLHGEPGVGKTFTAESIADEIKRPLYVLMSGELGSAVREVEAGLKRALKLVTAWKAVLLIDEADVFLEKRSSRDLARNSLVSIFLRTLEYFAGVMFLTTNRITSFDLAFQSRIHLALKYPPLDYDTRVDLWRLFLKRTISSSSSYPSSSTEEPQQQQQQQQQEKEVIWSAETLAEIAALDLNGRQIKNSVRAAYTLALSEGQPLGVQHIRDVLDTVREFRNDFNPALQANQAQQEFIEVDPGEFSKIDV